jgi:hypothetical protein
MENEYRSIGKIVNITKEFLDDQFGEHEWDKEMIVKFNIDIGHGDAIYRLRGRNKNILNTFDYNILVKK